MERSDMDLDRWVDDRLALLDPPSAWHPDADRALAQVRARGRRIGRGPIWAAVALAAAAAVSVGLWMLRTQAPSGSAVEPLAHARGSDRSPDRKGGVKASARNYKQSGSPTAPVAVEIYLDYECVHCPAFYQQVVSPLMAQYVATGKVRLLHRDFPMLPHQHARLAARYANAAGRSGYYEAAVDQIFQTLASWSRDGDIDAQLAQALPARVMQRVRDLVQHGPEMDAGVDEDLAMAHRDGLTFVPAVVLAAQGKRHVLGHITSFGELKAALDPLLEAQVANPGNPSTLADFNAGDATREAYQRATDLLKALEVSAGDWVADVGAGSGYYSMRLSSIVGPEGKVFAEDISDNMLEWLNRRVKLFELRNVEIVKGAADNPKLPAGALAAVLVVNSYHHFSDHQAMAAQVLQSLKPGGHLVIADYSLPEHRTESRENQIKLHEIDPVLVRAELTQAGFEVRKLEDPFLKRMPDVKTYEIGRSDMWLMTAVGRNRP